MAWDADSRWKGGMTTYARHGDSLIRANRKPAKRRSRFRARRAENEMKKEVLGETRSERKFGEGGAGGFGERDAGATQPNTEEEQTSWRF
jgi:hypothetical protein